MSTRATGTRAANGALELRRNFSQAPGELWKYLVDSERLALWFGPWSGDPHTGAVDMVLLAEEGHPSARVEILECDKTGFVLKVRTGEGSQSWQLELFIETSVDGSELIFQMPGIDPAMAGSVGPGWEFYLDRLATAAAGGDPAAVVFEPDYYPALSGYYDQLFRPGAGSACGSARAGPSLCDLSCLLCTSLASFRQIIAGQGSREGFRLANERPRLGSLGRARMPGAPYKGVSCWAWHWTSQQ